MAKKIPTKPLQSEIQYIQSEELKRLFREHQGRDMTPEEIKAEGELFSKIKITKGKKIPIKKPRDLSTAKRATSKEIQASIDAIQAERDRIPTKSLPSTTSTHTPDEVAKAKEELNAKYRGIKEADVLRHERTLLNDPLTGKNDPAYMKTHTGSFAYKMNTIYPEIQPTELDKIQKEWGVEMPTKKSYKQVPKNINAVPRAGSPYGGQMPIQPTSLNVANVSRLATSKAQRVVQKVVRSKAMGKVGKVASHPVARIAGRGLEVVGATLAAKEIGMDVIGIAGDIKRRVNRPSAEYDPSKYGKIIPSRSKIGIKVPLPKVAVSSVQRVSERTKKPRTQTQRNAEQVAIKPTYINKPMNLTGSKPKSSRVDKIGSTNTRNKVIRSVPQSASRSITPKRPDQIVENLSFLNAPSFTSSVRVSPVRPIPTRVQMPEQFMSPSMSLVTIPRLKSLKELGVSKWR